jgi:hypothetical protein
MTTVIEAGCAECHHGSSEPLIEKHEFDTVEEAKEWAMTQGWLLLDSSDWRPHPQGGEHVVVGQGSVWILP